MTKTIYGRTRNPDFWQKKYNWDECGLKKNARQTMREESTKSQTKKKFKG